VRLVLQRVSSASVTIDGTVRGAIERGLLILLGVAAGDTEDDVRWLAEKSAALRIFPDDAGLMNRSVRDIGGVLLVRESSQNCSCPDSSCR
jgi:D-tyrosyl-tRNA(Tyr) deacylase